MRDVTAFGTAALMAWLLGFDGFTVLATGEVDGELELLAETTAELVGCLGVWGGGAGEGPPPRVGAEVDEAAFLRATGIADLTSGRSARLLDVIVGRSATCWAGGTALAPHFGVDPGFRHPPDDPDLIPVLG